MNYISDRHHLVMQALHEIPKDTRIYKELELEVDLCTASSFIFCDVQSLEIIKRIELAIEQWLEIQFKAEQDLI